MKSIVLVIAVTLCPGCGMYMLSKMADLCARNGGVEEMEVDGGWIRVKCVDGRIRTRRVE